VLHLFSLGYKLPKTIRMPFQGHRIELLDFRWLLKQRPPKYQLSFTINYNIITVDGSPRSERSAQGECAKTTTIYTRKNVTLL